MVGPDKGFYRLLEIKRDPMLDVQTLKTVIENIPLLFVDLCLSCDGQILLGKRRNELLIEIWRNPGGWIHTNEA